MSNTVSPQLTRAAIDVAVAKEGLDSIKQQGKASVELIESAGEAAQAARQEVARQSPPGIGSMIDFYV